MKDETRYPSAKKDLGLATGSNATGPYGSASAPFTVQWVEGPSIIKNGDEWFVYYDEYTRGYYGALKSKDLENWDVITELIQFPDGARHGTVFSVTGFIPDNNVYEGFRWEETPVNKKSISYCDNRNHISKKLDISISSSDIICHSNFGSIEEVWITDIEGKIVRKVLPRSSGFVWDRLNDSHRRVAPGLYFIKARVQDSYYIARILLAK